MPFRQSMKHVFPTCTYRGRRGWQWEGRGGEWRRGEANGGGGWAWLGQTGRSDVGKRGRGRVRGQGNVVVVCLCQLHCDRCFCSHGLTLTYADTGTRMHMLMHAHICTCIHTHTQYRRMHAHTCKHACTHACTHTHNTHTNANTGGWGAFAVRMFSCIIKIIITQVRMWFSISEQSDCCKCFWEGEGVLWLWRPWGHRTGSQAACWEEREQVCVGLNKSVWCLFRTRKRRRRMALAPASRGRRH